jgi:hypothetical protein
MRITPFERSLPCRFQAGMGDPLLEIRTDGGCLQRMFLPRGPFDFSWPRTSDEDIYQSPGALLPVRTGRYVGHADERPKQIEWVEIASYITGLDGVLCQRVNRSLDLTAGTFIQLRGASNQRVQRRSDDLLGRNVVNEQQHPGSQRFQRWHGLSEVECRGRELFHLRPIDRLQKRIARRKVAIQSARSDAGLFGDVVQAGACP